MTSYDMNKWNLNIWYPLVDYPICICKTNKSPIQTWGMVTCVHKITYLLVTLLSLLVHRLAPRLLLVSLRHELDQHLFIVKVTDTGATDLSWALGWVLCQLSWLAAHMSVFYGFCFNYLSFQSLIIAVAIQNWYLGRSPQTSVPRVLTSLFSTRLTWHLCDICRLLSSFVVICHGSSWWSGRPNGFTGVHGTCVWVLVWDGWGGHQIRCSQDDKCEPESSRRSSGVVCLLFISIVYFESGFSMWSVSIYLCLSLGRVLVLFLNSWGCHWWQLFDG